MNIKNIKGGKYLVTGGAGFIGSNLVGFLLEHGAALVNILDNFSTGAFKNIAEYEHLKECRIIEGDIRNINDCYKACEDTNYVFHQAALGSVPRSIQDPITTNEVNISGFLNMMVAAKEKKIERIVYAASSSTYGDSIKLPKVEGCIGNPLSPYAVTKYVNELYASVFTKLYGMKTVGLRYFNVFGPKQSPDGPYAAVIPLFINAILEKKSPFINGNGEQTRDFTYIDNVIMANICAMFTQTADVNGQIFNIAIGETTSLNTLFNIIQNIEDINIKPIYRKEREGDVRNSLADISKAKNMLQYYPTIHIKEGLIKTYHWFKNNQ